MTTIDRYNPKDYPTFKEWWEAKGVHPPPPEFLKDNGFVFRTYKGVQGGAWFLRFEGIPLACVEWMTLKPGLPLKDARAVADAIESHICNVALARGVETLIGFAKSGGMVREAVARGYELGASPVQLVFKEL